MEQKMTIIELYNLREIINQKINDFETEKENLFIKITSSDDNDINSLKDNWDNLLSKKY